MKFKHSPFCVFALILSLFPLGVQADTTSNAKKAIEAQYARETSAMMKKDLKTALSVNAPDFIYYQKNGQKGDLKQMTATMKQVLTMASNIKASTKIAKFTLKGNQATVTTQGYAEMTLPTPQNNQTATPQNKQTVKLVVNDSSEDIWQNSGGKWLRKQTRILSNNTTVNGKPLPQQP